MGSIGRKGRKMLAPGMLNGLVMSGRRPLIKGFFAALRLIVGAVMSSFW